MLIQDPVSEAERSQTEQRTQLDPTSLNTDALLENPRKSEGVNFQQTESVSLSSSSSSSEQPVKQRALSSSLSVDLVAHYAFDESLGVTAIDSSSNSNHGTLLGGPTRATGYIGAGAIDFAADFDRMEAADHAALNFAGNDFSISFWFNSGLPPGANARVLGQSGGADGWVVFSDSGGDLNFSAFGSTATASLNVSGFLDNSWHHFSVQRNGNTFELFVDGVFQTNTVVAAGNVDSADVLRFGASSAISSEYDGELDEVRIYDRALSAAEISELAAPALIVDTTSDVADGDTSSIKALRADKGTDGQISLREAIIATNNSANSASPDEIHFDIAGAGPHSIAITSALPQITDTVVIDGTTDPDFTSSPIIELDGSGAGASTSGLELANGSDGSTIRGLIINRFSQDGISVLAGADGNTIVGNYIGTGAMGNESLGNADDGIHIRSGGNTVGGTTSADRNVIADNARGITTQAHTVGNTITGNYVGVTAAGNAALGNSITGIRIHAGAQNNVIGGTTAAERNVISGNGIRGIRIAGAATFANSIQGNYIGTDATGTTAIANGSGVTTDNDAHDNVIGGTTAGSGNLIRFNTGVGVLLTMGSDDNNAIVGNSIYENGGIGIDTGAAGISNNDAEDVDTGANDGLNIPVLTGVEQNGANLDVDFASDLPSGNYRIEFFDNASGLDSSGFGEGENFVGFAHITVTGAVGYETFSTTLSGVTASDVLNITATATEADGGFTAFSSTSEFSSQFNGAGVLVVDTTDDTLDGDTSSITTLLGNRGADGVISLREAITAANNTANGASPDEIHFNISGAGPHTISVASAGLPDITDTVIIDGTTEPSFAGTSPVIVLNGTGTAANVDGLRFVSGSDGSTIKGLTINQFNRNGIHIDTSHGNTVQGNYLGTNAAGSAALGNGSNGISIFDSNNTQLGGTALAERNVVAGNPNLAADIVRADGTIVEGNNFGTNAAGNSLLTGSGMVAINDSDNVQFGGTAANAGNVVGGNTNGMWVLAGSTAAVIEGNFIGTDRSESVDLGGSGWGINIVGASSNTIGGSAVAGNAIANWAGDGVSVKGSSSDVSIVGNRIYLNNGLGIDLNDDGVTGNDNGDGDPGPNELQNYPDIDDAVTNGVNSITIDGGFNSAAASNYRIDFYASAAANGSGFGEGQRHLGFALVTTNGAGDVNYSETLTAAVTDGEFISATATEDLGGGNFGSTSEFSAAVSATLPLPRVDLDGDNSTGAADPNYFGAFTEGAGAVAARDSDAIVSDGDSANLVSITITLSNVLNGAAEILSADTTGTSITANYVSATGVLLLSGSDTVANYQQVLRTVQYNNLSAVPDTTPRSLSFVANDGDNDGPPAVSIITVSATNNGPAILSLDDNPTFSEGLSAVVLDSTANPTDVELDADNSGNGNYDGSSVTLVRNGGPSTDDIFSFNNGSGISLVGSELIKNGQSIASFDLITTAGELVVSFTDANGETPTSLDVDNIFRQITYSNGSDDPPANVQINWAFNDGNNGSQGSGGALLAAGNMNVDIAAANDEEQLTTNALFTVLEGSTGNGIGTGLLETVDVDNSTTEIVYTLDTTPANGTLRLNGVALVSSSTFTQANIDSGLLSYDHNGSDTNTDAFDFTVNDGIGTSTSDTFSISISDTNDAPVLSGANNLANINEDETSNGGTAVSALISGFYADTDTPGGIAVVAVDDTNGIWEYSTNNGVSWNAFAAVSSSSARLLSAAAGNLVRFVPDLNWSGTVSDGISFHAWDASSGSNGNAIDISGGQVAEQFNSAAYTNNDGTDLWAAPWVEIDDDGLAASGNILISAGTLSIDNQDAGGFESAQRAVDLSGMSTASLSVDYSGFSSGGADVFSIQASDDGGSTWVTLEQVTAPLDTNFSGSLSYELSNFIGLTANSMIRLGIALGFGGPGQFVAFDNVRIDYTPTGGSSSISLNDEAASITVNSVNDAPLASNMSAAEGYTEDTSLNLVDIVVVDVDSDVTVTLSLSDDAAGSLSTGTSGAVTSTYNTGTGVWSASGAVADVNTLLAGLTFTPTLDYDQNVTISTFVSDGVAPPVTGTKSVTATAVNDPPTATNLSAAESYTEDTPVNLVDIVVSDVDHATTTVTLTLSDSAAGMLSTGTSGVVTSTYNAGTGVWAASGAVADVNALLAGVTFSPALDYNSNLSIATSVSDGVASPVTDTKNVTGTAVNDAPTATNLSAVESFTEDTPVNLIDIVVSDVDHGTTAVSLTLSDTAAGALSTGTSGAVTSTYDAGSGVWSASGAIADVNALLAGVTFTPALDYDQNFSILTSVSDGVAPAVTGSKAVTATPVNDPPLATNLSTGENYVEDTALNLIDIVVTDVDNAVVTATLTLSDVAAGALSTGTSGAVSSSYNAGTGVWTASGAVADVNALLAGVVFTPTLDYNSNFSIATFVSDGVAPALTGTKSVTASLVNDPPSATNLSAAETYTEDTALDLSDIVVSDVDHSTTTVSLTLSDPAAGALSTATAGAASSTYNAGTGVWSASGAITDVNALLAGVTYTPVLDYDADFTIATSVSDGVAAPVTGLKTVTATPVNDAPLATNLSSPESLIEDGSFDLTDIVVSDVDNATTTVSLTLSDPLAGQLSTATSGAVSSTYNVVTGVWSATGAVADVNALLAGVTFTAATDYDQDFSIATSVSDGSAPALTGVKVVTITAVNDAPTATNLSAAETYTEDTPINLVDIVVSDVDNSNIAVTLVLSDAAAGTLSTATSGAVTSSYDADTGVWSASGALADVNTLLAAVVFTPTAHYNSDFSIATSVDDGIATAVTGTKSVTGVAVNDAPTATNLTTDETYLEDVPHDLLDIVVTDVDDANVIVTLTLSDPLIGSFNTGTSGAVSSSYNSITGIWQAAGLLADVNSLLASLVFTPAPDVSGDVSITSTISDGTAPDVTGVKTLFGTAVNDAPIATNLNAPETFVEDTSLDLADIIISDIDSTNVTVTLTLSNPAAGELTTNTAGAISSSFNTVSGVWTASGPIADVNTLLVDVSFVPSPNFSEDFNLITSVVDGLAPAVLGNKPISNVAVNDPPTATNLNTAETYTEDTPHTLANIVVTDVDSPNITVILTLSDPAAGTLSTGSINALTSMFDSTTGEWRASGAIDDVNALLAGIVFTPGANYNADVEITVSISDGIAIPLTGIRTLSGIAVNDAPVGQGEQFDLIEDGSLLIEVDNLLSNDADVDGDELEFILVDGPQFGQLTLNDDGDLQYHPTAGFVGRDFFTYRVSDGDLESAMLTVNLLVQDNGAQGTVITESEEPVEEPEEEVEDTPQTTPPVRLEAPVTPAEDTDAQQHLDTILPTFDVQTVATRQASNDYAFEPAAVNADDTPIKRAIMSLGNQEFDLDAVEQLFADDDLWRDIRQVDEQLENNRFVVQTLAGSSAVLSTGIIAWILRGGSLLASLLATIPAWRSFDPLLIMAKKRKKDRAQSAGDQKVNEIFN